MLQLDLTVEMVTDVAHRLPSNSGSGGTNSVCLQKWILCFWEASGELQQMIVGFAECLVNHRPPWSAYQAMMTRQLIRIEEHPGV